MKAFVDIDVMTSLAENLSTLFIECAGGVDSNGNIPFYVERLSKEFSRKASSTLIKALEDAFSAEIYLVADEKK